MAGLGIRSVTMLAPSAFLASAAGTQKLRALILQRCQFDIEKLTKAWNHLTSVSGQNIPANCSWIIQRQFDEVMVIASYQSVLNMYDEPFH